MLRFPSKAAAEANLKADGFEFDGKWWKKMSKVDDFYGGYPSLALCSIVHHKVHPEYEAPDFYEIRFH